MDDATRARLTRAARPTYPNGDPRPDVAVIRRADLHQALGDLARCEDGAAFDVDDEAHADG